MAILPPPIDTVKAAFSSLKDIVFITAGGFKAVYKVSIGSKTEALKIIEVITTAGASDEEKELERTELRARMNREVNVLKEMNIPELVKLGSMNLSPVNFNGKDYLAYTEEYINGSDLMKLIKASGPLPQEQELRTLFISLLKAIRALWADGIVHRDIKPANIMKTDNPSRPFILMDLGIAYAVNETGITNNTVNVPATIKYVAPEMLFRGFRSTIDYRSDLYTAALTTYEYAAFKHPLARQTDDFQAAGQPDRPVATPASLHRRSRPGA